MWRRMGVRIVGITAPRSARAGAQIAYWDNILDRVGQAVEWIKDLINVPSVPDYAGRINQTTPKE